MQAILPQAVLKESKHCGLRAPLRKGRGPPVHDLEEHLQEGCGVDRQKF